MGRESLAALVEARLDETAGARYLDLCIDVIRCECPKCKGPRREIVLSAGGRWDRVTKTSDASAAETSRVFSLQPAQLDAGRWFALWLAARLRGEHIAGPDGEPAFTLALVGGRRGGKSDLAVKAATLYAVAVPRAIVWVVVPVEGDSPEIERLLEEQLPAAWYRRVGLTYHLQNGGVIEILSSYDPDDLKRGRCDIALIHEGQKHREKTYAILAAAAADRGGLVILAANPPDTAEGEWVAELVERSRAGKTDEVVSEIDARLNPHIDHAALAALAKKLDERTYQREVLGLFLARTDVVMYAFSPSELHGNVRPTGRGAGGQMLEDVTRAFTARLLGQPFERVHGMDFQGTPYQAAATLRLFADPEDPTGLEPLIWATDDVEVEQGTEDDLVNALEARSYTGEDAVIPDATGDFQDSARTKGRSSWDRLRARGWRKLYYPVPGAKTNPTPKTERFVVANSLFKSFAGKRRLFIDPRCAYLIRALRLWETRNGIPHWRSDYAHIIDALTYPLYRLFPRRAPRSGRLEFEMVQRRPTVDVEEED